MLQYNWMCPIFLSGELEWSESEDDGGFQTAETHEL